MVDVAVVGRIHPRVLPHSVPQPRLRQEFSKRSRYNGGKPGRSKICKKNYSLTKKNTLPFGSI